MQPKSAFQDLSIGVLIPAYNRQRDVLTAVLSVLAQTRPPERIVIIDDGSDVPLTCDLEAPANTAISIIRLPRNSGAAAARQAGLDSLATTHVAFLDADDTWHESKLARQIDYLSQVTEPLQTAVACGWTPVTSGGAALEPRMPRASRSLADFCSGCWYCPGSTVLMPRALLVDVGGYDVRLRRLEDLDLFLRLALAGCTVAVAPVYGAFIRKGQNARRRDADPAAALLRNKFLGDGPCRLPGAQLQQRLESWLCVEEAAAAYNERAYLRAVNRMLLSLRYIPRLAVQIEDWWPAQPPRTSVHN